MGYFLAINNKQLGVCLRMLYANGYQGSVETVMNSKHRIEFHISIAVSNERFQELDAVYRTLIS